jgi:hypothetical protein
VEVGTTTERARTEINRRKRRTRRSITARTRSGDNKKRNGTELGPKWTDSEKRTTKRALDRPHTPDVCSGGVPPVCVLIATYFRSEIISVVGAAF